MGFEVYAFSALIISAWIKIGQRFFMERGADRVGTLMFYNTIASLILLPFAIQKPIDNISLNSWALLLASGIIWLGAGSLHLEAMKHLKASQTDVFMTFRIIILAIIGLVFFHEELSIYSILGGTLVITSMLINVEWKSFDSGQGMNQAISATILAAIAVTMDKYLLAFVDPILVAFFGFFVPAAFLIATKRDAYHTIIPSLKKCGILFVIIPVLGVGRYHFMLQAYNLGQVSTVTVILQATVVVIFLIEVFLFKERQQLMRRTACCSLCAIGAAIVSVF